MIALQIGLILFLLLLLGFVYQDEFRKLRLARKTAKTDRFWQSGKDRRKFVRIDAQVDVLYELLSHELVQKHSSKSRNISLGGINLALKEKLPTQTFLKLELTLPQNPRPVFVTGKIVWVKEIFNHSAPDQERFFATGIQFTQMPAGDEEVLRGFINHKIKNEGGQLNEH